MTKIHQIVRDTIELLLSAVAISLSGRMHGLCMDTISDLERLLPS